MCWVSVKEDDDYSVPSRPVKHSRRREHSPRRPVRVEYIEERRPSPRASATYIVSAPPAPLYNPIVIAPEPAPSVSHHSRAHTVVAESVHGGTAKSVKEDKGQQMVEVEEEEEEEEESHSESSASGTKSKSGKSRYSHSHAPSRHSDSKSRASRAASKAPKSEYDIVDREYRRERAFASPERGHFDTYRYVEAPQDRNRDRRSSAPRSSYGDDPRASATSYRRERERITIQDEDGRSHRESRR